MSFDIEHQDVYYSQIIGEHHAQMSNVPMAIIKESLVRQADMHKGRIDILEYGTGISTIWYGKTFPEANIVAVEGDRQWMSMVVGWMDKEKLNNIHLIFHEQTGNWRNPDEPVNPEYLSIPEGPFDLIINDGGIRELVAETLMLDMDKYLKPGGLYLRHDYEKLLKGDWVGKGLDGTFNRKTYESFASEHPNYSVITMNGNGTWGAVCEMGGLWRRP